MKFIYRFARFVPCFVFLAFGLCCFAYNASASAKEAAEYVLAVPKKALISPNSGRLEVEQELPVHFAGGLARVSFIIPAEASNLNMVVHDHAVARWISTPVLLPASSFGASRRGKAEEERDKTRAALETAKAKMTVWKEQTGQATAQELQQRQKLMTDEMPALAIQLEELQRKLALIESELAELPQNSGIGQQIIVTLTSESRPAGSIRISYSYDLPRCGWQPVYDFNSISSKGFEDMVEVRLIAEVWQFTGIDWANTEITLATMAQGPREPAPLPEWVVGAAQPKPLSGKTAVYKARAAQGEPAELALNEAEDGKAGISQVTADTAAIYARWTLAAKGLPEGRSQTVIAKDAWKAPMQWLARPSTNDNRVWMYAKCELAPNGIWPAGIARFSVENQSVGSGQFNPAGREAVLYFGSDPRMSVRTVIDTDKQGQTGFINTSKTWTGSWTYTLSNRHEKAVKVRVERPAPRIAQDNITVNYKDEPPSKLNDKEHMIYWEITVPEMGKSAIQHSVIISSPEKLPLLPDVP